MQAIRLSLDELRGGIPVQNMQKKLGFLDFAYSGANPTGVRQKMIENENNSQYRPVQMTYYERDYGADIVDVAADFTCDPGNEKQLKTQILQPTMFVGDKFKITEAYMREVVQETGNIAEIRDKYLMEKMRVLREKVDTMLFAKAGASAGRNPGANGGAGAANTVWTPVELLTHDNKLTYANFDVILNTMEDNQIAGNFAAIGLGNLRHYFNLLGVSAANGDGADYREIMNNQGYGFFKDQNTLEALGAANRFLAIAPGAVQPFSYNVNRAEYNVRISDTEGKGTLQDPIYPLLRWDYDYAYQRCTGPDTTSGEYVFRLWLYFDLFVVPTNTFNAADSLNGMNGIFKYEATKMAAPAPSA